MNLLKKAAASLAATAMVLAPVAASAAESFNGARAVSAVEDQSDLNGSSAWILALLAGGAILAAILIAGGNNNNRPTSP